jgi:hypothetical protein
LVILSIPKLKATLRVKKIFLLEKETRNRDIQNIYNVEGKQPKKIMLTHHIEKKC